ncbi:short-chain dehydrogenase [Leptolyngbya sp. Heron Island J]|uniref:SDR family NAD(P)-dependent oxidoreductase n=1 Tax=Leptolyngbya sp. Heron Island J TaxID=1385935 RepID=UPI0003B9624A|nr:SDR family oxidoreductase [Leptolyngbya sp. Heron Island J]ESA38734.1 short-chain dehydrogenase [Leptolyngbya sp. Heron Island J]
MANINRRKILATGTAAVAGMATVAASQANANTLNPVEPAAANPDGRFVGKVVLITGATSGIGETTAKAFARAGAQVAFNGRRANLGQQVESDIRAAGGEATYMQSDVRDPQQVEQFVNATVERYGRLDIAFNNAGIFMTPIEIQDMELANYRDMIATNLDGVFYSMRYELPIMIEQGSGIIINMASVAGHRGFANTPHYNASKHGVIGLTKAAATANARRNIRINSISPLAVDTPMLRRSFEYQGLTYEQMAPNFVTPRIMTTEEMAEAVMFLASNEATAINGMDLDVTGGQLA